MKSEIIDLVIKEADSFVDPPRFKTKKEKEKNLSDLEKLLKDRLADGSMNQIQYDAMMQTLNKVKRLPLKRD